MEKLVTHERMKEEFDNLVEQGLVMQNDKFSYKLTKRGMKYVDKLVVDKLGLYILFAFKHVKMLNLENGKE